MNEKYPSPRYRNTWEDVILDPPKQLKAPNLRKYAPACQPHVLHVRCHSLRQNVTTRGLWNRTYMASSFTNQKRKLTWLAGKSTIWRCISYWKFVKFPACHIRFRRVHCEDGTVDGSCTTFWAQLICRMSFISSFSWRPLPKCWEIICCCGHSYRGGKLTKFSFHPGLAELVNNDMWQHTLWIKSTLIEAFWITIK